MNSFDFIMHQTHIHIGVFHFATANMCCNQTKVTLECVHCVQFTEHVDHINDDDKLKTKNNRPFQVGMNTVSPESTIQIDQLQI